LPRAVVAAVKEKYWQPREVVAAAGEGYGQAEACADYLGRLLAARASAPGRLPPHPVSFRAKRGAYSAVVRRGRAAQT
jgi:hypothetical protein